MVSVEHFLVMILSSLLVAGGYSYPNLRLLFQDGLAGDSGKTRSLRANSLLVATGRWEWKPAGMASHESPPLPRQKREIVFSQKNSSESALEVTTLPLQEDETSQPFMGFSTQLLEEDETTQSGWAGNGSSTEAVRTSRLLRNPSTETPVAHLSTMVDTAPLHGQMTTTDLSEDFTETEGAKDSSHLSYTMNTTPSHTTTTAATSTVPVMIWGHGLKSSVNATGSTRSSLLPPMANSRPIPTVQTTAVSKKDSPHDDKMLGQCLLAISLLALVAGIFIITTFVLAALLLRQRRAYKLRQHKHTEMVCISSLLAAEEEEVSGGRVARPRRMKALGENGSETDMDNLTLNSFLPDH